MLIFCQSHGTPSIVQINHVGRQSLIGKRSMMKSTIAPSPIPISLGKNIFAKTIQHIAIGTPKTNKRTDEYGATPKDRMKFLFRIIDAFRAIVPLTFAVGIKINSADFSTGGLTGDESQDQIRWIDEHGGTYEAPTMCGNEYQSRSECTRKREAYFIEFAAKVRNMTILFL